METLYLKMTVPGTNKRLADATREDLEAAICYCEQHANRCYQKADRQLRHLAKRQGLIARKSRWDGLWYSANEQNWLESSPNGLDDNEAFAFLAQSGEMRRGGGMSVTPIRPGVDLRCPVPSVVLVAALLRCVSCKHEWHGDIDPFGAVPKEAARCPRCLRHWGPNAA